MHRPRLLILDEPINGLDPEGIVEVRELMVELAYNGSTIFLSSHILSEIAKLANRIGIIHQGQLIKELTTPDLKAQLIKKLLIQTTDNPKAIDQLVLQYPTVLNDNGEIEVSGTKAINQPEAISKLLVEKGLPPKQVYLFVEDLEMFFLRTIRRKES